MDDSDPDISFDENGVCNHCVRYSQMEKSYLSVNMGKLPKVVHDIKKTRCGNRYDCVLGLSGGIDSSYTAYLAHEEGLNVLLTHFDNGFDDPMAADNVERIVKNTGWDYEPFTMDFDEYRSIWKAYLRASVIDIEVPTDHAITASLYRLAKKHKIRFILTGSNIATEQIMPLSWGYRKNDLANLKAICKEQGVKLRTFPRCGLPHLLWYRIVKKICRVPLLDYVQYNVSEAKQLLAKEWGWQSYGSKHYESILTRFYQTYILPFKFGVDKRKAHLSNLICSGQLSRDEALKTLESPPLSVSQIEADAAIVLNRLRLSKEEFYEIIGFDRVSHYAYATDDWMYSLLRIAKKITGVNINV